MIVVGDERVEAGGDTSWYFEVVTADRRGNTFIFQVKDGSVCRGSALFECRTAGEKKKDLFAKFSAFRGTYLEGDCVDQELADLGLALAELLK